MHADELDLQLLPPVVAAAVAGGRALTITLNLIGNLLLLFAIVVKGFRLDLGVPCSG